MHFDKPGVETKVMESENEVFGFYSWNKQHGKAALIHFFVEKSKRNPSRARFLIRSFINALTSKKIKDVLVCVDKKDSHLMKFLSYIFKKVMIYSMTPDGVYVKMEVPSHG